MIASEETFLLLVVSNNNSLLTTHLPPVDLTGNTFIQLIIQFMASLSISYIMHLIF